MKKNKKYYFIYETVNLINKMTYRGMHSTDNIEDGYLGSGSKLQTALEEFGENNFQKTILEFCSSYDEMVLTEARWVDEEYASNPNTYNIIKGGKVLDSFDIKQIQLYRKELKHVKKGKDCLQRLNQIITSKINEYNQFLKLDDLNSIDGMKENGYVVVIDTNMFFHKMTKQDIINQNMERILSITNEFDLHKSFQHKTHKTYNQIVTIFNNQITKHTHDSYDSHYTLFNPYSKLIRVIYTSYENHPCRSPEKEVTYVNKENESTIQRRLMDGESKSLDYFTLPSNFCVTVDPTGKVFYVKNDNPKILSGQLTIVDMNNLNPNYNQFKNMKGSNYYVQKTDTRVVVGEPKTFNKPPVTVMAKFLTQQQWQIDILVKYWFNEKAEKQYMKLNNPIYLTFATVLPIEEDANYQEIILTHKITKKEIIVTRYEYKHSHELNFFYKFTDTVKYRKEKEIEDNQKCFIYHEQQKVKTICLKKHVEQFLKQGWKYGTPFSLETKHNPKNKYKPVTLNCTELTLGRS